MSIHHAVNVPLEVCQDDEVGVLLHANSDRTVCSALHGSAVTGEQIIHNFDLFTNKMNSKPYERLENEKAYIC